MPHLLPVHQVTAVEDGHTGKISEGRGNEEIVAFPVGTDAGVGIPSRQDGVVERGTVRERIFLVEVVINLLDKVDEQRGGNFHCRQVVSP